MAETWPTLSLAEWKDTYATLHMWTQIVGKIRLRKTPRVNHWWNAALYVSPSGLTTSSIPSGTGAFEINFDFIDHKLTIHTSDGIEKRLDLASRSVADFYRELMTQLKSIGIDVRITPKPDEVPDPIPFEEDVVHASYDPEYVNRFWRALVQIDRVFNVFRARFIGKCSPVHFFWGSFDLAVSRFSGKRAPERPEADAITREGYSHEVISAGFWPGSGAIREAAFYSYTAPAPAGFDQETPRPESVFYSKDIGGFILMYEDARRASSPDAVLLEFLQSTYEAGAKAAGWDRAALERS